MKTFKEFLNESANHKVKLLRDLQPNDYFYFCHQDEEPMKLKVHHTEKEKDGSLVIYPYAKRSGRLVFDPKDNVFGPNDGFYFIVDAGSVDHSRTFQSLDMDYIVGVDLQAFKKVLAEQFDDGFEKDTNENHWRDWTK